MVRIGEMLEDVTVCATRLNIKIVRLTGRVDATIIEGVDDPKNIRIIMNMITKHVYPDFRGRFGIQDLRTLKKLLLLGKERNGTVGVARDKYFDPPLVSAIAIKSGDLVSYHQLMRDNLPLQMVNKLGALNWDLSFALAKSRTKAFSKIAPTMAKFDEKNFSITTRDAKLIFTIGDEKDERTAGVPKITIHDDVKTDIVPDVQWKCGSFMKVMRACGNRNPLMQISNQGVIKFYFDTGVAEYLICLPGFKS